MPLEELALHSNELPSSTDIVASCRGAHCVMAYDAVRVLESRD